MKSITPFLLVAMLMLSCQSNRPKTEITKETPAAEISAVNNGDVDFDSFFINKTMRMDFFHTGKTGEEMFAVDRIVSDGEWGGSEKILIDKLELGPYFFEILDRDSKVLLYSRGFANIFGEWQTIPEAKEGWGTFHESLRFPWPKNPVTVVIKKRDAENTFRQIWTADIDPSSRQVNPANRINTNRVNVIAENGSSQEKLDIVILGDGYSSAEMEKFRNDASRLAGVLLSAEPFSSRRNDINIRSVETPSEVSGVNRPHNGVFKRTPLSVSYSAFDSERYALAYDNRTIRDVASAVPYEFMVILLNERTYGGGGIYNLYTTVAADNMFSNYIMVHEMGHHMAALADEYYTSSVSYEMPEITVEPYETNVTALLDKENLKWKDLVEEGTPIPTPWNKEEFDAFGYRIQQERDSIRKNLLPENVMEDLFVRQMNAENEFFAKEKHSGKVGAFEGANYYQKGMYRPQLDCIMYTRHLVFCEVCRRSIGQVIDQYSK
ncbi:MAG TPA: M64 family metallopeptidase [Bacteroidales bacterium]|nr:M64 family metallopeptidase [Bacteroidales bacterium]